MELEAVTGWVVHGEHAARVVAPPYDALTAAQREAAAAADPASYLSALPAGAPPAAEEVDAAMRRCRAHLDRLLGEGRFARLDRPSLLVLAVTRERPAHRDGDGGRTVGGDAGGDDGGDVGGGSATSVAVLGDVDVHAFGDGRIRPHEATDPERVAHLARYLEVVGVASSPVAVVHRRGAEVADATDAVRERPPALAFTDAGRGEHVALWAVEDPALVRRLQAAIAATGSAYLADGHHRAAAVARFAHDRALPPGHPDARVLCAVLPDDHLEVTPFHRTVDLGPHPRLAAALAAGDLTRLTDAGWTVRPGADRPGPPADPWEVTAPGRWHLLHAGRWWVVTPAAEDVRGARTGAGGQTDVSGMRGTGGTSGGGGVGGAARPGSDPVEAAVSDPVAALDVVRLEALLADLGLPAGATRPLAPTTLDAQQPWADPAGQMLGIALHPPSWAQVQAVADAGRTLPPKTTYLTPKLRSGLVVVPRSPAGS